MIDKKEDLNVYGHNLPEERGEGREGIRERDTAADLDETREQRSGEGGGMGRQHTPKDEPAPGEWHHDQEDIEQPVDEQTDHYQTPMPPRHAPYSDEVPS